ncbi:uncharacterized protein BO96DRAFT_410971 [Aspergillus niger CBS 101883]|uniref:uncharacterized protein n=1 Tax=Aspergillus lacticoffeatus (strain CBS 101883) TaxID=1450533 RepID=UPI000D8049D3|nr:uncharacterized protein BO96DRAFT_410971 [Aspergillus niger CBS 101883]PYH58084.1 hypothetical protein BO96DRAFT_410971 [Aspergillus niger CBS 101883]
MRTLFGEEEQGDFDSLWNWNVVQNNGEFSVAKHLLPFIYLSLSIYTCYACVTSTGGGLVC